MAPLQRHQETINVGCPSKASERKSIPLSDTANSPGENSSIKNDLPSNDPKKTDNMSTDVWRNNEDPTEFPVLSWMSSVMWPLMLTVPLVLNASGNAMHYTKVFPESWYMDDSDRPKPLGLCLGLITVAIGNLLCLSVFFFFKYGFMSQHGLEPLSIQKKGPRKYDYFEGVVTHLSQPEGFILLGGYLSGTWMFRLMPESYYSFDGGIEYAKVFACLVIQDGIQFVMHLLEHNVSPAFYKCSHKPHHRFTNPRLFDAFNGSMLDTICMILIPLYATANLVHCNVWSYMAFGSFYANWLTLIHSEYTFPWDQLFHRVGFGTPADHHVHHAFFKYNFGHLFTWFDRIWGTYRHPSEFAPKQFNKGV